MKPKLYLMWAVVSVLAGFAFLYQAIYDRPVGARVSVVGIVAGLVFIAMGVRNVVYRNSGWRAARSTR